MTRPDSPLPRAPRLLGALLVEACALLPDHLEQALEAQRSTGERLGETLVRLGLADEEEVAGALARQLGLVHVLPPLTPEPDAVALVPRGLALRRRVLPLAASAREIRVAMADPLDLSAVDDVQFRTGRRVATVVVSPRALQGAMRAVYGGLDNEAPEASDDLAETPGATSMSAALEASLASRAPVVRRVDRLLRQAVDAGASDLHLEPTEDGVAVRARIDGILRLVERIPGGDQQAILSRIKVMSGMDISVRRRPQDGGFRLEREAGENGAPGAVEGSGTRSAPARQTGPISRATPLSIRASTLPVEGGEKAVLRVLDPTRVPSGLEELGFSPSDLERLRGLIRAGRGVVLAAGPTGSGKSSTLFGALGEVDRVRQNVVTLEDPIEYRVEGVNQVQVHPRAGLTFPAALRAVLRQDPDVIMVGEIRDRETAEIAMAAAVTGHLVLSTIHTTDAPGGITRLLQMGVPPHLVAGGLAGIVAQRLVRIRCPSCGGASRGCSECHEGYRGRTGVFELLVMDDALRDETMRGSGTEVLRRKATLGGMGSMAGDARRKVAEGSTTPHEVARVLHRDPGSRPPCSGCGGELPGWARGCPACGRSAGPECRCGSRLQPEWRYCPHCLRRASVPA